MTDDIRQPEQGSWPSAYEPPRVEPLGTVWERTGGAQGGSSDVGGLTATS